MKFWEVLKEENVNQFFENKTGDKFQVCATCNDNNFMLINVQDDEDITVRYSSDMLISENFYKVN